MRYTTLLIPGAAASALKGFNYGATNSDNSPMTQSDYQDLFCKAQSLPGVVSAFTSARLYTTIQAGTVDDPSQAIPAAIATGTQLLLGMWASSGQNLMDNEISALKSAIQTYGSAFTQLIVGISVGSEDLYRSSTSGSEADAGIGAAPDTIVDYISQVRESLQGFNLSVPIGHVDTWTAWINSSTSAVTQASDFIGMDAYPYWQHDMPNDVNAGGSLFQFAYSITQNITGKVVWVTETGWPTSGPQSGQAVASVENAQQYWDKVGCDTLFEQVNTFWFTLQDSSSNTSIPSFGILGDNDSPLYNLTCADNTQ